MASVQGISSAWCLRYAGINTPVCVAPKVKGRHTEKELERKLVDEVRSKGMMRLVWKGSGKKNQLC